MVERIRQALPQFQYTRQNPALVEKTLVTMNYGLHMSSSTTVVMAGEAAYVIFRKLGSIT